MGNGGMTQSITIFTIIAFPHSLQDQHCEGELRFTLDLYGFVKTFAIKCGSCLQILTNKNSSNTSFYRESFKKGHDLFQRSLQRAEHSAASKVGGYDDLGLGWVVQNGRSALRRQRWHQSSHAGFGSLAEKDPQELKCKTPWLWLAEVSSNAKPYDRPNWRFLMGKPMVLECLISRTPHKHMSSTNWVHCVHCRSTCAGCWFDDVFIWVLALQTSREI